MKRWILTIEKFNTKPLIYAETVEKARQAIAAPQRNCDVMSKDEVLETLKDRSFSKEDTIEWLYSEAKGEAK